MNSYIVYAINAQGKKIVDVFQAEHSASLHFLLDKNEYIPLSVFTVPKYLKGIVDYFSPKLTSEDAIGVLDNMAISLEAGIPLHTTLKDIADDTTNKDVQKIVTRISNSVASGESLSSSCTPYKKSFTQTIINLMQIGQETGKLDITLASGADFLKKLLSLRSNIKKALIYPLFTVFMMFVAISAWMIFVVPGLVEFFEDMEVELPPLTKFIIVTANFLDQYLMLIILLTIGFVIALIAFYKTNVFFRKSFQLFLLKIPVVSDLIKFHNISYIAESLRLSVMSGLTLYHSLKLLAESVENDLYRESIEEAISELEKGKRFSQAIQNNKLYTKFAVRIISIGEGTGKLERELGIVASIYFKKVDDLSNTIPKVIQPIVLVFGGLFMAMIMLGLMGPIYELISQI